MKKLTKVIITFGVFLLTGCLDPGDEIYLKSDQESGILFTHIPHTNINSGFSPDDANSSIRDVAGTNIYKLSPATPQGITTNLTEKWTMGFRYPGAAMDPELSEISRPSPQLGRPPR